MLGLPGIHLLTDKSHCLSLVVVIVIVIVIDTMFMVLSSWHSHCKSLPVVHLINAEQHHVTADLWTKPVILSQRSAYRQL